MKSLRLKSATLFPIFFFASYQKPCLMRDDSKKKKHFRASEWALGCNDFMIIKPFVGLQHDQINMVQV